MAELDTKPPDAPAPDKPSDNPFSSLDSSTDTFGGLLSGDAYKKASSELATEYKKYESSQDKLTVQQRRIAEERDAQLKRMMDAEGATAADMHPFNPEAAGARHSHGLWEQFGSPGFVFGMLASAFTGMPMTNALNAGAAAMKSINQGDLEGYNREFDAWKNNTDLVVKRFNMERDAFDQIEHLYKDKLDEWHAQALADASRFDDHKAQILLENGMYGPLLQARAEQIKLVEDITKARDQLDDNHTKQLIVDSILKDDDGKLKYDLHKNPQILVQAKMAADMAVGGKGMNPEQLAVGELVSSDEWKNASSSEKIKKLLDLKTNFQTRALQSQEDARQRQVIADSERAKDPEASEDVIIERTNKRIAESKKATPPKTATPKQAEDERERKAIEDDERAKDPKASDAEIIKRTNKALAESKKAVTIRTPKAMYINTYMEEVKAATGKPPSSDDIKRVDAIYTKTQAIARTLGTREANVRTNIKEAIGTGTLALQKSAALDRGDFVPLNQMEQLALSKTSSPELREFLNANAAFLTAYAQTMVRAGTSTVHSQERAAELLNPAEGPEAYERGVRILQKEMNIVLGAVSEVEEEELEGKKPGGDKLPEVTNFQVVK